MVGFLRFHIFWIIWAIIIFILSVMPSYRLKDISLDIMLADKIAHAGVYFLLVLMMYVAFQKQYQYNILRVKAYEATFMISFGFSVIIEIIQGTLCETRMFEWMDIMANLVGCLLGILTVKFLFQKQLCNTEE